MKRCEDGSKKGEVLERFRKFIALARGGPIKTEIKIEHDTGHSCFKSDIEVIKKAAWFNHDLMTRTDYTTDNESTKMSAQLFLYRLSKFLYYFESWDTFHLTSWPNPSTLEKLR